MSEVLQMSLRLVVGLSILLPLLPTFAIAQQGQPPAGAPIHPRLLLASMPEPPVPPDSLELVTGSAQSVQDAAQRAAILTLLSNAKALSNIRSFPYDLKT